MEVLKIFFSPEIFDNHLVKKGWDTLVDIFLVLLSPLLEYWGQFTCKLLRKTVEKSKKTQENNVKIGKYAS